MRIEIDIPKEFEEHFNQDKFKDSLERIMADIGRSLEIGINVCAGRYEYETIKMLAEALENSKSAYDIDNVVKELYEKRTEILLSNDYECEIINYCIDNFDKAIEIVKQGDIRKDV